MSFLAIGADNKRANIRMNRKTPQVYTDENDAKITLPAQSEATPKELKIGSRGAAPSPPTTSAAPASSSSLNVASSQAKKAAPQVNTQQNWALKNQIIDLEKKLERAQMQVMRMEDDARRAEDRVNSHAYAERELTQRTQKLSLDLARAQDTIARRDGDIKLLQLETQNLETSLQITDEEKGQWESGYRRLELDIKKVLFLFSLFIYVPAKII